MIQKEEYKKKREELDDCLIELDVPKQYWHSLAYLNQNLGKFSPQYTEGLYKAQLFNRTIELIHEISPTKLTRFYNGDNNND